MAELLRKPGKLPWARNKEGTENQDSKLQSWQCVCPGAFITVYNKGLGFCTTVGLVELGLRPIYFMVLPLHHDEDSGKGISPKLWKDYKLMPPSLRAVYLRMHMCMSLWLRSNSLTGFIGPQAMESSDMYRNFIATVDALVKMCSRSIDKWIVL